MPGMKIAIDSGFSKISFFTRMAFCIPDSPANIIPWIKGNATPFHVNLPFVSAMKRWCHSASLSQVDNTFR